LIYGNDYMTFTQKNYNGFVNEAGYSVSLGENLEMKLHDIKACKLSLQRSIV